MALTLMNFVSFESGGLEDFDSTSGITIESTPVYSGSYSVRCLSSGQSGRVPWTAGPVDAGTGHIAGVAFRKENDPPSTIGEIFRIVDDDGTSSVLELQLNTDGTVDLKNANNDIIDTSAALADDTWYYIEIYAQLNNASGDWEWFIDGVSEGSGTGADFTNGGTFGGAGSNIQLLGTAAGPVLFDHMYMLSGATAASDRLGSTIEMFTYQCDGDSTTTGTPTFGDWVETGDTPSVEEADETALEAAGASALTLTADMDGGANARGYAGGPSTGAPHDVSGTIVGAKWLFNMKRSNGAGTSMRYLYGNTGEAATSSADIEALLGTAYVGISQVAENDSTVVPTSAEDFRLGISAGTDDTGGRSIYCADAWCSILHVPAAAATDDADPYFIPSGQQQPVIEPWDAVAY